MTMSGSPNRVSPLPEPGDRARGLRACSSASSSPGVNPRLEGGWRTGSGPAPVQQWNTVARSGAANGRPGRDPGRPPRQLGHRAPASPTTAPARWWCSRRRAPSRSRASSRSGRSDSSCSAEKNRGCWVAGLRRGARGRGGQHPGGAGARQRHRAITGQALQGRTTWRGCGRSSSRRWPPSAPTACASANKGGTDHLSFLPYGVPGFNFDQVRGDTTTPTTRRATPTTRPSRAISSRPRRSWR